MTFKWLMMIMMMMFRSEIKNGVKKVYEKKGNVKLQFVKKNVKIMSKTLTFISKLVMPEYNL